MRGIAWLSAGVTIAVAFVAAAAVTPLVRRLASRAGIVDRPGPRKVHAQPTPLLGGWAIWVAVALTTLLAGLSGWLDDGRLNPTLIVALVAGGLVLMLGGTLEDRYSLPPGIQILFPTAAALLMVGAGLGVEIVSNPFGVGTIDVGQLAAWLPPVLAFAWLLGMTYTTKLLDGLDGLVGSLSVVAALAIFIASLAWDVPRSGTALLALAVAGACLGFLLYNWYPASIFLGEGGSTLLGFTLGVLAIISGAKIATAVLVLGVPMLDVAWVVARRLRRGQNPFRSPDMLHVHHRLLQTHLTQPQAVGVLTLIAACFASVALLQRTTGKLVALGSLLVVMLVLGYLLSRLGHRRDQSA